MNDLVLKYRNQNKDTVLENYMIWRTVASYYPDRQERERGENCLKETEDIFAPAVTSLYIKAKGIDKSQMARDQVRKRLIPKYPITDICYIACCIANKQLKIELGKIESFLGAFQEKVWGKTCGLSAIYCN